MSSRNRRFFDDDDDDDEQLSGWTRNRRSNGAPARDRRNGVSRDPLSEVRAIVEDEWRETLDDNFHPITLALDMLDTSSLGRAKELENFKKTNQQIETALQSTVNEHYQGFNSSVGTYGQITGSIGECQKQVRGTRDALLRAKVQLSTKRDDLLEMSAKSQQFQSMITFLRQISELKAIPEVLEQQLSKKHFLAAGETLNNAIYLANREDMLEIPALGDIRQYLKSQAIGVVEILVEELHNHLYLKSPYCDARWRPYSAGQADLPVVDFDQILRRDEGKTRSYTSFGPLEIELHQQKQSGEHEDLDDIEDRHPEVDSLAYIDILTQALYTMGKLPYALEIMNQRLPVETSQTVTRTIQEVRARHRGLGLMSELSPATLVSLNDLSEQTEPLSDLLWTLFSKWDAVLQAHRALYDAVGSLQDRKYTDKRASQSNNVAYDFGDVWLPIENELKTILNCYLRTQEQRSAETATQGALNELFAGRTARQRRSTLFTIGHATTDKEKPFAEEELELRDMLQRSVPGLLSEKNEKPMGSVVDATDLSEAHTLLAQATPFNILCMLRPTLAFLERAKRIVPNAIAVRGNSLTAFLDEFLASVFYPQLNNAVDALYRDATLDNTATQSKKRSDCVRVIEPTTERVLALVKHLETLLMEIPYNREIHAQTIFGVYANYYQKCTSWLSSLTMNENPNAHLGPLKLGPAWANRQRIRDIWAKFESAPANDLALSEAISEEIVVLFHIKKNFSILPSDLVQEPSMIDGLVKLYQAVVLTQSSLQQMQSLATQATTSHLDLSPEAQSALDSLIKTFATLRQSILLTLRMEFRTHLLYHLQVVLSLGNYNIAEKANVIDSVVTSMNADLQAICNSLVTLPEEQYRFLMAGVAKLSNRVLVEDSSSISIMTRYGAEKLRLDISALQQNLQNLVPDPAEADLSRALKFYEHFQGGLAGLTEHAKARTLDFTPTQAAKLLTLIYSVDLANETTKQGSKEAISTKRRQFNEQLASLTALMANEAGNQ